MRILTIGVFIVLLALLAGCAPRTTSQASFEELAYPERSNGPELTAAQHEQMADTLLEDGSPEAAFMHYAKARQLAEKRKDAARAATLRAKQGRVLLTQGHSDLALKEFQAVLVEFPENALALEGAGAVYLKSGLASEAKAQLARAAELDPTLWRAQQYLGVLASQEGDHAEAVRRFSLALELKPGQAGTLNNLGVALLMDGHREDALAAFRRALAAGAPQETAYNNIGLTLARMGRTEEALETFRFASDEPKAYNNLGYVLMLQGRAEEAARCFEKAIELSPTYYEKAFANLKQARLTESFRRSGIADAAQPAQSALPNPSVQPEMIAPVSADLPPEVRPASAPATATQAAPAAPAAPAFGLHVASFRTEERTRAYLAQLAEKHIAAVAVEVDLGDKGRWHRVLAGPYPTISAAAQARPALLTALRLDEAPIKKFQGQTPGIPPQATASPEATAGSAL